MNKNLYKPRNKINVEMEYMADLPTAKYDTVL